MQSSPADVVVSAEEKKKKAEKRAEVERKVAEGRAKLAAEKEMQKKAEEELTDTDTLDKFTKVYPGLNSSITLYGELHDKSYEQFLKKFIDYIYVQRGQKKIIIIETSDIMVKSMADFPFFSNIMSEPDNIEKKKYGVTATTAKNPILYFSSVLRHGGSFPNTQIVCGDCRIAETPNLSEECKKIIRETFKPESPPSSAVTAAAAAAESLKTPSTSAAEQGSSRSAADVAAVVIAFKKSWSKQLAFFENDKGEPLIVIEPIRERYLKIARNVVNILNYIETVEDLGKYIKYLDEFWIHLSDLQMLLSIINNMERNVDITLFVGKYHMKNLIELIEEFPFEKYLHDKMAAERSHSRWGLEAMGLMDAAISELQRKLEWRDVGKGVAAEATEGGRKRKKSVSVRRKKSVSVRRKKSVSVRRKKSGSRKYVKNTKK
jgi:hypothetical protein